MCHADTLSRNDSAILLGEAEKYFHEANEILMKDPAKAYDLCQRAAARYEKVLLSSKFQNGKIYYNLGNIYFKMNDLGRAILAYRHSLQYNPNDVQLLQNLEYARRQRLDKFHEQEKTKILKTIFFWHYDFTPSTRQILFLILFLLFWIQALTLLWKHPFGLKITCIMTLFFLISSTLSLLITARQQIRENPGVIIAKEVIARKGDGNSYAPSFTDPLHTGTEFILLEKRTGWSEIQLPDGQSAWVPNQDIACLK